LNSQRKGLGRPGRGPGGDGRVTGARSRRERAGYLLALLPLFVTGSAHAFAQASSARVAAGAIDIDPGGVGKWYRLGPASVSLAVAALFDYESNRMADGEEPTDNPQRYGIMAKFTGFAPPVGKTWPNWSLTWGSNSSAFTSTSGSSFTKPMASLIPWTLYDVAETAAASITLGVWTARGAPTARAEATVLDPWTHRFEAAADSGLHHAVLFEIALDSIRLTPPSQPTRWSTSRFSVWGDIGEVTVSLHDSANVWAFQPVVSIAPGWRAYLNVAFDDSASNMAVPVEATATDVENVLAQGYDAQAHTWTWVGPGLQISMLKDVGPDPIEATTEINLATSDAGEGVAVSSIGDSYSPVHTVQPLPNPFQPARSRRVTLQIAPGMAGPTHVEIRRPDGRRVRRMTIASNAPVEWDGRDDEGRAVSAGVYFVTLSNARERSAARIVLLR
jgi:hypothetical protein